jgi:hypothetical protein
LGNPSAALKDAEESLKDDPDFFKVGDNTDQFMAWQLGNLCKS